MHREENDQSLIGGLLAAPVVQEIKAVGRLYWFLLKVSMPATFIVLLALMTASPDGTMPVAKFDGQSRWADLGAMPVLALALSVIYRPSKSKIEGWRGVLASLCLASVFYLLLYGAGFGMAFFAFTFGAMGFVRLALWPLKRIGRALMRNEDIQQVVGLFWLIGAILWTAVDWRSNSDAT